MTKRKSRKQKNDDKNIYKTGAVLVLIIIMFSTIAFVMNSSPKATNTAISQSTSLSPSDYVNNFTDNTSAHVLIDVRTQEEFSSGHIAGAINIPVEELDQRLSEVPTDKDIVVYCRSGNRSATASGILTSNGYDDVYDMGGIIAWQQAGYPIE